MVQFLKALTDCLFLYEKKWLTIHRPLIYLRFIDDLFLIINNLIILESLKESFGDLELTFNIEKTVNYLDLEITRNDLTSLLDFSLFFDSLSFALYFGYKT